jgi:hypothetical protein
VLAIGLKCRTRDILEHSLNKHGNRIKPLFELSYIIIPSNRIVIQEKMHDQRSLK